LLAYLILTVFRVINFMILQTAVCKHEVRQRRQDFDQKFA